MLGINASPPPLCCILRQHIRFLEKERKNIKTTFIFLYPAASFRLSPCVCFWEIWSYDETPGDPSVQYVRARDRWCCSAACNVIKEMNRLGYNYVCGCMLALVYFSKLSLVRFIFPPFDFVWMPTSTCFRVNMDIVLDWTPPWNQSTLSRIFLGFVVCIIPSPLWQNPLFVDSEPNGSKLTTWTFKRFLKKKKKSCGKPRSIWNLLLLLSAFNLF